MTKFALLVGVVVGVAGCGPKTGDLARQADDAVWGRGMYAPGTPGGTPVNGGRPASPTGMTEAERPIEVVRRPPALIAQYQRAVANTLRDPGAAQFRDVVVVRNAEGDALCGEVNGKNAYGGYIGFSSFFAPMLRLGERYRTVPFMADRVGVGYVMERCVPR